AQQLATTTLTVATDDPEDLFDLFQPGETAQGSSPGAFQATSHVRPISARTVTQDRGTAAPVGGPNAADSQSRPATHRGHVESVDASRGLVQVRFEHGGAVPVGSPVAIVH